MTLKQPVPEPPSARSMTAPRADISADEPRQLLRLMANGLSDQAISRKLDLSRRTVQRRVRSLMNQYGVQTRFQLGMRAAAILEGRKAAS
ncbi:helix-turn-helix domain-containing protein [Stackebrandtia soli]|uniref:helix-turn-helix domain-containing protein n=1 Tax=Stackebrandtia soli TaxID=1892856 RepID=UPI0039E734A1